MSVRASASSTRTHIHIFTINYYNKTQNRSKSQILNNIVPTIFFYYLKPELVGYDIVYA